jgi:carbon-monoxide dehydrogenase medium subunit
MKPVDFALLVAPDVAAAGQMLASAGPDAKYLAGGQSLGPMLNLRLSRPSTLVALARTQGLRGATETADSVVYGAATTHAEIEDGAVPDATPGWLPRIAQGIAYRAVRNRGTIGGSLVHADPAADWLVTLSALGAWLLLNGPAGVRRANLPDFMTAPFSTILAPEDILTAVCVPKPSRGARFGYYKFTRKTGEFARASCAVLLDPARKITRIAVGALEAPPVLLPVAAQDQPAAALAQAMPGRPPESMALHAQAVARALALAA